jgi:cyclopropane fatty-acyl-phospholipid synthase-like methyltransferase
MSFNAKDLRIWNRLFDDVPLQWRTAPPSEAMKACLACFRRHGVRTVWDVGCGIGRWSIFLAQAGFTVKGSDFAENGIRYASRWAAEEGLGIEFACAPLTRPPFPGQRFDAVVAALVLDNVSRAEMAQALQHMRSSLRANGLVFCVFNPILSREEVEKQKEAGNPTSGVTSVTYSDLDIQRAFAGFDLVSSAGYEQATRGFLFRLGSGHSASCL